MTRGMAILLMKGYVMTSLQFNGDVYPDGYGDEFINKLSKVKDDTDFDIFINEFNDLHFGYDNDEVTFGHPNEVLYSEDNIVNLINLSSRFNSDWIFFKNLTGSTVKFRVKHKGNIKIIDVLSRETIRFNYDTLTYEGNHIIK